MSGHAGFFGLGFGLGFRAADEDAVLDGTVGEVAYEGGRVACYLGSDKKARIRWIDDRRLVYGTLNATTKDLQALFDWWAR